MTQDILTLNPLSEILTKEHAIGIIVGRKASGKTIQMVSLLDDYSFGNVSPCIPQRSSIIADVNDELGDFQFF